MTLDVRHQIKFMKPCLQMKCRKKEQKMKDVQELEEVQFPKEEYKAPNHAWYFNKNKNKNKNERRCLLQTWSTHCFCDADEP